MFLTGTPKKNTGTYLNSIPAPFYIGAICISKRPGQGTPLYSERSTATGRAIDGPTRAIDEEDSRQVSVADPGHPFTGRRALSKSPPQQSIKQTRPKENAINCSRGEIRASLCRQRHKGRVCVCGELGAVPASSRRAERAANPNGGCSGGLVMSVKTSRLTPGERDIKKL